MLPFVQLGWAGQQRELPRHALIQLIAFGGLALALWKGRLSRSAPLVRGAAACAVALAAVVVASDSPGRSLAGGYEGRAGVLALWAWLALLVAPPRADLLPWAVRGLLCVGVVQGGLCVLQNQVGQVATGSMGHPMFVAMLTVPVALVALGAWLDDEVRWRVLAAMALFTSGLVLVLAARRGPLLAWGVGVALVLWWSCDRRRVGLGVGLSVLGALAGHLLTRQRETLGQRLRDTGADFAVAGGFDTAAQRLDFYRVVLEVFPEHPWLGAGFGSFGDVYASHKAPGMHKYELMVHNVLLDFVFSGGLVGLAGLMCVVAAVAVVVRAVVRTPAGMPGRALRVAVAAAGAAHLVQWQFNFDQPGVAAWVWTLLGMMAAAEGAGPVPAGGAGRAWAALPAALAVLTPWMLVAEGFAAVGAVHESSGRLAEAARFYGTAARLVPHECQYVLLAATAAERADRSGSAVQRVASLRPCVVREPHNGFAHHYLARALEDSGDAAPATRAEALQHFHRACELGPSDALFQLGLGRALLVRGRAAEAVGPAETCARLEPRNARCAQLLADVWAALGRPAEAAAATARAAELAR